MSILGRPGGSRSRRQQLGGAIIVALMLGSTLLSGLSIAHSTSPLPPSTTAQDRSSAVSPTVATPYSYASLGGPVGIPPGASNTSGPGVFYQSSSLPSTSFANQTCVFGSCYNISNDVSVNFTSSGLLAAAYTSLTDQSPCASLQSSSVSNIAFTTSSDGGANWSPVTYLGNPVCTGVSAGYADAWEPTITSLANGTLVLAYVEYNLTAGAVPPLSAYSWPPTQSRLVLTESYDNGSSWTIPQVLNISNPPSAPPGLQYTPALPSITAFGNTIYLTWMSLTVENSIGSVALLVSSTGGASWSPTIPVTMGAGAGYAMDPQVTTDAAGRVYIAYTSNVTQESFFCGLEGCLDFFPPVWEGSVWVASSYTNGTVFNYSQVANSVPLGTPGWAGWSNPAEFGPFETPAPQVVASATTGNLYVAFTAGYSENATTLGCDNGALGCLVNTPYFFTSYDQGASWTEGNLNTAILDPNGIDPTSSAADASDSVTTLGLATAGGTEYIEAGVYNGSICFGAGPCGAQTEVVLSTSDDGFSFTEPAILTAEYTPEPFAWTGEYDPVAVVNGTPQFYWTSNVCPGYATSPCGGYPASSLPAAGIERSTLYTGPGVTVSFSASGLRSDLNWSVNVLGNVRIGLGNQTLSVSGVPTGTQILWTVPNVFVPGYEFLPPASGTTPSSPQTLSSNLSVTLSFTEFVSVTYGYSVPNINGPACQVGIYGEYPLSACPPGFYPECIGPPGNAFVEGNQSWGCFSEYFSPVPPTGPEWVPVGSLQQIGLLPMPAYPCNYPNGGIYGYLFCDATNYTVTFAGWSGAGSGSISSSNPNITFRPLGPVTESATFFVTQVCEFEIDIYGGVPYIYDMSCGTFTSDLTIQETGLPSGTSWGVTLSGAAGVGGFTGPAGGPITNPSASLGLGTITPWNVPSSVPGEVYVGTIPGGDAVVLPITGAVTVSYALEPSGSFSVPVSVSSAGLPQGTDGNVTFTSVATSAVTSVSPSATGVDISLPSGEYVVSASVVRTTTGTDYVPTAIYANVGLAGYSNQSGTSPLTATLDGPSAVTVTYTPEYWVTVGASLGGHATPASQWVVYGHTLLLTATADPGYLFVGWSGSGPGATSGSSAQLASVTILPLGPVVEVAVFEPTPAPQYTLTFEEFGLPSGQPYSVTVGNATFTGSGTFSVGNVSAGTYLVTVPEVTGFGVSMARFVEVDLTATSGLVGPNLTVSANDALLATFAIEYFVSLGQVGDGSLSMAPGQYWELDGAQLSITATPASGYAFEEWLGSVNGGSSQILGTQPTLLFTLSGSLVLVAQFGLAPPVVPTYYQLTVGETGLPAGTSWQFVLTPGHGGSGTTSSIVAPGLNGSYGLSVPAVYVGTGIRFVPVTNATAQLDVTSNTSATVTFQEQYLVTVSASALGYPANTEEAWVVAGTALLLSAPSPPASGWSFLGWQGSGQGSYTGPNSSQSVVPVGPVSETATYAQGQVSNGTAAPSVGDWVALGVVVVVLLIVGIAEGIALGRRPRRRQPAARPAPEPTPTESIAPPGAAVAPATPPTPPPTASPAEWSETPSTSEKPWLEK